MNEDEELKIEEYFEQFISDMEYQCSFCKKWFPRLTLDCNMKYHLGLIPIGAFRLCRGGGIKPLDMREI